jgi:hypothetical protein
MNKKGTCTNYPAKELLGIALNKKGTCTNYSAKELLEIASHPTYLLIIKQIFLGNKTSSGIAKSLIKKQGGIFDRLAKMFEEKLVKRDNKNWEINEEGFKGVFLIPLFSYGSLKEIPEEIFNLEMIKFLVLNSIEGQNLAGIAAQMKLLFIDLPKNKQMKELILKQLKH